MIHYDPHEWRSHLFDVEGSMIREIFARVATVTLWAAAVVAFHRQVRPVDFPSIVHTLVGFALSLLLVFRTNASYDRFWEGRKLWGSIVNHTRNIARCSHVHLRREPDLHARVVLWAAAFTHALRHSLRRQRGLGSVADRLPKAEVEAVLAAQHVPLAVTVRLTSALREALDKGLISDILFTHLDRHVVELSDMAGACERIHKTPLPFVYMVHIRRALILYAGTLPFVLVAPLGWLTVPSTFVVAYFLYGIEEIGVEIEDPFGVDSNDLPLEGISDTIQTNLLAVLDDYPPR